MDINLRRKGLQNQKIKIIALVLYVIVFVAISIWIIYKGFDIVKTSEKVYVNNSEIDYRVYLKENDYFEEEYLGKGKKYIASLIKNIDIDYKYTLQSNDYSDGNYNYCVVASLVVNEQGKDNILWSKDYQVTLPQEVVFTNQKLISVEENVSINYDYYNDIVASFKKDYAVPIDANLIVKLRVNSNIENENDVYIISKEPSLNIPLSEQTIETVIEEISNEESINEYTYLDKPFLHYSLVALGIIFVMLYFVIGVNILLKIIKILKNQNQYEIFLKKIFDDYDQIIVNVQSMPHVKEKTILELKSFEEMIDAQLEIRKPIIFYEDIENKVATFILNDGLQCFKYIVKESDFVK